MKLPVVSRAPVHRFLRYFVTLLLLYLALVLDFPFTI
jgi:hypothetical protein